MSLLIQKMHKQPIIFTKITIKEIKIILENETSLESKLLYYKMIRSNDGKNVWIE